MTHSLLQQISKPFSRKLENGLQRKTPGSPGTKLFIASTAFSAYRNRHLGSLMYCCAAWELVGKCFDQCSFECIDFRGPSQIIASLPRERIAEREAEICNLSWTQTEKDNALAKCRLGLRAWCTKNPMLCLHAVTDEDGHPWRMWTNLAGDSVKIGARSLRHHCHETILGYVQKAPDGIRWEIDKNEFGELMATKKRILLPAPMGFHTAFTGVQEGWDRRFHSRFINIYLRVACSRSRWDFVQPLQMCGEMVLSILIQRA